MASTTPNIGLTLPTGAEKVSRQIINENNTKIDAAIGSLNDSFGTLQSLYTIRINTLLTYTATSVTNFLDQIMDYVLSKGGGSYIMGVAWSQHYFCLVTASAQSSTRCVIEVVPQVGNMACVYFAEYNNGTRNYKQIAMSNIS